MISSEDVGVLLAIRGVTRVHRFSAGEAKSFSRNGEVLAPPQVRALARGLEQVGRAAGARPKTLTVNGDRGRLLFQFDGRDEVVCVQASAEVDVPRLMLELQSLHREPVKTPAERAILRTALQLAAVTAAPEVLISTATLVPPDGEAGSNASNVASAANDAEPSNHPTVAPTASAIAAASSTDVAAATPSEGTPVARVEISETAEPAAQQTGDAQRALQALSDTARVYFGKRVVVRYLTSARPASLACFDVTEEGVVHVTDARPLTVAELRDVRAWFRAVIKRAQIVALDFEQDMTRAIGVDLAWILEGEKA